MPLSHFSDPLPTCPASDFPADLVVLHYASGRDANLFVWVDGCTEISDGRIAAAGPDISLLDLPIASGWY